MSPRPGSYSKLARKVLKRTNNAAIIFEGRNCPPNAPESHRCPACQSAPASRYEHPKLCPYYSVKLDPKNTTTKTLYRIVRAFTDMEAEEVWQGNKALRKYMIFMKCKDVLEKEVRYKHPEDCQWCNKNVPKMERLNLAELARTLAEGNGYELGC